MALPDKLTAIGNAIRQQTGGTELIPLDDMPGKIASIKDGQASTGPLDPVQVYKNTRPPRLANHAGATG